MINLLIRFSIKNRFFVVLMALALLADSIYNAFNLPIEGVGIRSELGIKLYGDRVPKCSDC